MVVEALHLLLGGKPDPDRVRVGTDEAIVEGLFAVGDTEWVLRRTVPARGRSRAYVNGELATAATLAELGASLLELHGQHAQQALHPAADPACRARPVRRHRPAGRSWRPVAVWPSARRRWRSSVVTTVPGRASWTCCRFQVDEIDAVAPVDGEDEALAAEEDLLAAAVTHQQAAQRGCGAAR